MVVFHALVRGKVVANEAGANARNLVGAIRAHDFLDKIDIALQIAAITWDFPFRGFGSAGLL